jgi:transcriptional regulator with XRE-family HTH domain
MLIFPEQCRAARGLLNWSQEHLALAAGISRSTIKDFEAQRHCLQRSSEKMLVETFAAAGVELLGDGAEGLGVRIKR